MKIMNNNKYAEIENLIDVILTGDERDAAKVASELGRRQVKKAVPALIVALHSKDALESWNALDDRTKIAFGSVGEGIFTINELRCAAAEALGKIGDEKAIPELLTVFNSEDSNDMDIHDAAAKALANFSKGQHSFNKP